MRPAPDPAIAVAAGALSALALFALSRPYLGIAQDGVLYVGRAVADADPAGLGQDILFAHDGQSRFSVFTLLADRLVASLGPGRASWWLAHAALLLWFAAAAAFASRLARGALLWAMLACVALAGARYGGDGGFRYGEPYAIPRPLAEAAVLVALAAWLAGRRIAAAAFLCVATLLHPIMAAGGVAILAGLACWRDPRWLVAPVAGALLLVVLALAGAPFATRLVTIVDPEWSRALHITNVTYPARWSADIWAAILLQAGTLLLAARALHGETRRLLVATAAVAGLGVAAATLLGEWAGSLLVLQVQPWRPLWLLACVSAATLPIAARHLWRLGPPGRIALACLAAAWLSDAAPVTFGALAATAGLLGRGRLSLATPLVVKAAWAVVALVALVWGVERILVAFDVWTSAPESALYLAPLWIGEIWKPLAAIAIVAWAVAERPRVAPVPALAVAMALVAIASVGSDARSGLIRRLETWRPDPALTALLADRPGEVLWLRGGVLQPWVLAGRPNWISAVQGSSMLFSHDLATLWTERMDRLIAARLGDESDRSPNLRMAERRAIAPGLDDIASFCAAPDAPVLLFGPLGEGFRPPVGLAAGIYRMPAPVVSVAAGPEGQPVWSEASDVAVIPCRTR